MHLDRLWTVCRPDCVVRRSPRGRGTPSSLLVRTANVSPNPAQSHFGITGWAPLRVIYQREQNNPYEQDKANLEANRTCRDTSFFSRLRPRHLEQAQLLPRMDGPLRNSRKATSSRRRESDSDASRPARAFDRSRVARHYLSQVFRGSPSAMAFLSTLSTHHT